MATAKHCIVREACFIAHGSPEAAIDEALSRLRAEALEIVQGWGRPFRPQLHFKLELERPPATPPRCQFVLVKKNGPSPCHAEAGRPNEACPCVCHSVAAACPEVPAGGSA